jgi:hypothetical protein
MQALQKNEHYDTVIVKLSYLKNLMRIKKEMGDILAQLEKINFQDVVKILTLVRNEVKDELGKARIENHIKKIKNLTGE